MFNLWRLLAHTKTIEELLFADDCALLTQEMGEALRHTIRCLSDAANAFSLRKKTEVLY